jgi:chromate transport protein ChrA
MNLFRILLRGLAIILVSFLLLLLLTRYHDSFGLNQEDADQIATIIMIAVTVLALNNGFRALRKLKNHD